MNRAALEILARRWRRYHAFRVFGISTAVACTAIGLLFPLNHQVAAVAGLVALAGTGLGLRRGTPRIRANTIAEHLNRLCPSLEESAGLWLRDAGDLALPERLQLERLNRSWDSLPRPRPGSPDLRRLLPASIALVLAMVFAGAVVRRSTPLRPSLPPIAQTSPSLGSDRSLGLSAFIEIHPPSYLGQSSRRVDSLSAEVEEGSEVVWNFVAASHVAGIELSGHGTNASFSTQPRGEGRFQIRRVVADSWAYQVSVQPSDGPAILRPGMHLLQVRRDTPPRLTWRLPSLSRTSIAPTQGLGAVRIEVMASDDHAVAEVRLVLTVAKGSGEGLKFREQSEVLQGSPQPGSSNAVYGRTLDPTALGMEPGDELYVHAVAVDTRRPTPNESRTETRCVALMGPTTTASEPAVMLSGVRPIPQYFRSQRQLILDTEQLLAEQPRLSESQFRARSENIGIDQKLLRLRYGQFLGEEFEPTSAGAANEAVAMEWAATLRNPSGQDTDRSAAIGRAVEATHAHGPDPAQQVRPFTAREMMASVAHLHDSPEAATFYDERLKAALRTVLAAMWDAEGHLRTAQPAAALPAEHRALAILKEIQQADRLSLGRVGSDLPPIPVEERRLRGELDGVPASTPGTPVSPRVDRDADALRLAVSSLSTGSPVSLGSDAAARVDAALWRAAETQPERYLPALELWRAGASRPPAYARETLLRAITSLPPAAEESPHPRRASHPEWEDRYLDALGRPSSRQP